MEAIDSIKKYVSTSYEIIVVDNASVDKTKEKIPAYDPGIRFLANLVNVGFSAANNQGFAIAKGEYVLLLNPDAKLIDSNIDKALAYLVSKPGHVLGPKVLNPDLSLQNSILGFPGLRSLLKETFFLGSLTKKSDHPVVPSVPYALSGSCLLMHSSIYKQLNGLDENLFWMDDIDFCYRAGELGIATVYFPDWSVVHHIGQSSKKNYKLVITNQLISKIKYFKKHGQKLNYLFSIVVTEFQILTRTVIFLIISPFKAIFRSKLFAYIHAQKMIIRYIFTDQNNLL